MNKIRMSIRAGLMASFAGLTVLVITSAVAGYYVLNTIIAKQTVISEEALPASLEASELSSSARDLVDFVNKFDRSNSVEKVDLLSDEFFNSLDHVQVITGHLRDHASDTSLVDAADYLVGQLSDVVVDFIDVSIRRIELNANTVSNNAIVTENATGLSKLSETLASNARATVSNRISRLYDTLEDPDLLDETYDSIDFVLDIDQPNLARMTDLRIFSLMLVQNAIQIASATTHEELDSHHTAAEKSLEAIARSIRSIDDPDRQTVAQNYLDQLLPVFDRKNYSGFHITRSFWIQLQEDVANTRSELDELQITLDGTVTRIVKQSEEQIAIAIEEAGTEAVTGKQTLISMAAIAVVMSIMLSYLYIHRNILRRLVSLRSATASLANGEMDITTPPSSHDELGQMAASLSVFKESMLEQRRLEQEDLKRQEQQTMVVEQLADGMRKVADGDLTAQITQQFPASYEMLRTDFNRAVQSLGQVMATVMDTAETLALSAAEISNASLHLATRTEHSAANLEETASAVSDLTTSVHSASGGANQCFEFSRGAQDKAEQSRTVVDRTITTMQEIEEAGQEIANILQMIDEIAFQTNLLALNASVEASRAGEAGRGFAVVASEVRELALRVTKAAQDIGGIIQLSNSKISDGVVLVDQAGTALQEIIANVAEITQGVQAIATSTQDQASKLARIDTAVSDQESSVQQNAAMTEETTAASQIMSGKADDLKDLINQFRIHQSAGGETQEQRLAS